MARPTPDGDLRRIRFSTKIKRGDQLDRLPASPKPHSDHYAEQEYSDKYENILPMAVTFQVRRLGFAKLGQLDWHFTPSVFRRSLQPPLLRPRIHWRDGGRYRRFCRPKLACVIGQFGC